MKYMLLIYMNEQAMNQAEREHCYAASTQLCHDLSAQGKFLGAGPLHPVTSATSVRVRDGKRLVTDGPFAETHEQLGGYYLIDAKDLDEAIAIAGRIPPVSKGTVEIRPLVELAGLPEKKVVKFMLLCYDDEQYWANAGQAVHQAAMDEAAATCRELSEKGQYILASPLAPVATATSVRVRDGKRLVTDGPFAETREVLGGFYLIDVPDLNAAIAIAARHPGAPVGTVEIRPVLELAGLPVEVHASDR